MRRDKCISQRSSIGCVFPSRISIGWKFSLNLPENKEIEQSIELFRRPRVPALSPEAHHQASKAKAPPTVKRVVSSSRADNERRQDLAAASNDQAPQKQEGGIGVCSVGRGQKCTTLVLVTTHSSALDSMGMWPFAARRNGRNGNGAPVRQDVGVNGTGMVFMVVLALQFGLQPLLQTECVDYQRVDRVSLVITTEVTKIFLCSFVILSSGPNIYRPMLASWTLKGSLATAAFPAAVYAVQNCLSQVAYVNLDSLTFNLLNQTKTLFAALCLYLVMGKKQSPQQLVALSLLLVAALILNASGEGGGISAFASSGAAAAGDDGAATGGSLEEAVAASAANTRFWLGVVPVVGAALLSGLAGAWTQRTLQRSGRNASQLSLELAVYGVGTLLLTSGYWYGGPDGLGKEWRRDFFRGWTPWTWLPVLSQAAGGMLVGQVTKHAGSVSKGFALIGGIFVTAAVQRSMGRSALTSAHWIAAVLVAGGTYLHSSYPHRPQKEAGKVA